MGVCYFVPNPIISLLNLELSLKGDYLFWVYVIVLCCEITFLKFCIVAASVEIYTEFEL